MNRAKAMRACAGLAAFGVAAVFASCNTTEYGRNRAEGAASQRSVQADRAREAYDAQQTQRAQQIQMQQSAERSRASQYLNK
ncbi:MAG: hypothetical protein JNK53_00780 [Phycisphaerae bacterium]|nr:hypothetical protein [Phycisphaerae bacterium]